MCDSKKDGAYYAIKGYVYQYDKTILEVLNNPDTDISFEVSQDINYKNYVLQVKHKEKKDYTSSKIKPAVIQLLKLFKQNPSHKFCLYCYFKNKSPQKWQLSLEDLNEILKYSRTKDAKTKTLQIEQEFPLILRKNFINNFCVEFSCDFETQFQEVLTKLQEYFKVTKEESIFYHSCFRSKLLELSLQEQSRKTLSVFDLQSSLSSTRELIFNTAYKKYLSQEEYLKLAKKKYFNAIQPNNFKRFFIIDCDNYISNTELINIISNLSSNCYCLHNNKKDFLPAPYICLRQLSADKQTSLKTDMLCCLNFSDGTCFNGDKFELSNLICHPMLEDSKIEAKLINEENILDLLSWDNNIREIYHLYFFDNLDLDIPDGYREIKIQINETQDISKLIERNKKWKRCRSV